MMDCQTCNDLLLDLAYGELDEVRAAAVRKHADGCADCRRALGRIKQGRALARQLAVEEAPPVSAALRAALEAATARPAAVTAAGSIVPPSNASGSGGGEVTGRNTPARGVTRWFERLGEVAMRRQVAMAAVFVLTIGVGFIYYQSHPRPMSTPDDRVPDVVPAVEVSSGRDTPAGTPPLTTTPGRTRPTSLNAVARNNNTVAPQPVVPAPGPTAERPSEERTGHADPSAQAARPPTPASPGNTAVVADQENQAGDDPHEITPPHRPVPVLPNLDPNSRPDEIQPAPQTPPLGASVNAPPARFASPPPPPSLDEQTNNSANQFRPNVFVAQQAQTQIAPPANTNALVPQQNVPRVAANNGSGNVATNAQNGVPTTNAVTQQQRAPQPSLDLHAREVQARQQLDAARTPNEQDEVRLHLGSILAMSGRYDEAIQTLRRVAATPELRARAQVQIDALERDRAAQADASQSAEVARRARASSPPSAASNNAGGTSSTTRPPSGPSVMPRPARQRAPHDNYASPSAAY